MQKILPWKCCYVRVQNSTTKCYFNRPGKTRRRSIKSMLALFCCILTSGLFQFMGIRRLIPFCPCYEKPSITSIYQSYRVFSLLLSQKISTQQDITSTESDQFLAPKFAVLRRNKATNSSTSTDPFSAATKSLVLGNLFNFERFAITFARAFYHWG